MPTDITPVARIHAQIRTLVENCKSVAIARMIKDLRAQGLCMDQESPEDALLQIDMSVLPLSSARNDIAGTSREAIEGGLVALAQAATALSRLAGKRLEDEGTLSDLATFAVRAPSVFLQTADEPTETNENTDNPKMCEKNTLLTPQKTTISLLKSSLDVIYESLATEHEIEVIDNLRMIIWRSDPVSFADTATQWMLGVSSAENLIDDLEDGGRWILSSIVMAGLGSIKLGMRLFPDQVTPELIEMVETVERNNFVPQ